MEPDAGPARRLWAGPGERAAAGGGRGSRARPPPGLHLRARAPGQPVHPRGRGPGALAVLLAPAVEQRARVVRLLPRPIPCLLARRLARDDWREWTPAR